MLFECIIQDFNISIWEKAERQQICRSHVKNLAQLVRGYSSLQLSDWGKYKAPDFNSVTPTQRLGSTRKM